MTEANAATPDVATTAGTADVNVEACASVPSHLVEGHTDQDCHGARSDMQQASRQFARMEEIHGVDFQHAITNALTAVGLRPAAAYMHTDEQA